MHIVISSYFKFTVFSETHIAKNPQPVTIYSNMDSHSAYYLENHSFEGRSLFTVIMKSHIRYESVAAIRLSIDDTYIFRRVLTAKTFVYN
jgi:hypothetical protein